MNHLPSAKDGSLPEIRVPILADTAGEVAIYDGGDYKTFPERQGFRTYIDLNGEDRILCIADLPRHSYLSTLAFVQAWLYFGTLRTALDTLGLEVDEDVFIREDVDGPILDTSAFLDIFKSPPPTPRAFDWWTARRPFVEVLKDVRRVGKYESEQASRQEVRRLCNYVVAQVEDLEVSWLLSQHAQGPFGEITLSIRVLAWSLIALNFEADEIEPWEIYGSFGTMRPSLTPLLRALSTSNGWCPHQALHLCTKITPSALYYLSSMKRTRKANHTACVHAESCRASNIAQDFVAKHVKPCNGQDCSVVAPGNPQRLLEILRNGDLPIIVAFKHDGALKLWYDVAKPRIEYTAASHVWADGLGDPQHNHLPECQLVRLMDRLYHARRAMHYSYSTTFGSRSLQAPLHQFNKRYKRFMERPIAFWLDAFCIPASSVDEEIVRLKHEAIMRMVPTYGMARQVIILDSELQRIPKTTPGIEHLAALLVCTWRSRYWTHQELTLAGAGPAIIQFKQPVRLQTLLDTISEGGSPYKRRGIDRLSVRYMKDRTLQRAQVESIAREFTSLLQESKVGTTELLLKGPSRSSARSFLPNLWRYLDWRASNAGVPEHGGCGAVSSEEPALCQKICTEFSRIC